MSRNALDGESHQDTAVFPVSHFIHPVIMPSRMRAVLVANFCVSLMAATSEETAPRAPQPSSTPPDPFNVSIPPGFCPCNETKVEDDKLRGQKALETHVSKWELNCSTNQPFMMY